MPQMIESLRVFLATPSDVEQETQSVSAAVESLNRTVGQSDGLILELVHWKTHCWPGVSTDAQAVINSQIGAHDIFIGIYWRRFGSPTPRAPSGTAEEFDRAYREWQKRPKMNLMFYFCRKPFYPDSEEDVSQLADILKFRRSLREKGLLYWEYEDPAKFESLVREHLSQIIYHRQKRLRNKADGSRPQKMQQLFGSASGATEVVSKLDALLQTQSAVLIRLDIDGFKRLNDRIGVIAADECLRGSAAHLSAVCKGKGEIYRISGDEFAVIIANATLDEGLATAERIRSALETGAPFNITASLGVVAAGPGAMKGGAMLHEARRATLFSKLSGKNRVTSGPLMSREVKRLEEWVWRESSDPSR